MRPGDTIDVVLNGRLQTFRVTGIGLSPEFVFATRSALPLPDDRNLVILWAGEEALAGAFDMRGSFNDLAMTVAPGASMPSVIADLDRRLAPYGGTGAYGRSELPSHRFLEDELAEQETLSIVMPAIFFGIAAFLLNVILNRLVDAQREQIASLKALGFTNSSIALHYVKLVSIIALLGAMLGIVLGYWLALAVIESYRGFFRFPVLEAHLDPWIISAAVLASLLTANAAAASAVLRIAKLAPADAMRPQLPATARALPGLSRITGYRIPLQTVMVLRSIVGRPFRTLFTIIGIALAVPLVMFGLFWFDAIDHMIDVSFGRIERGDAFLTFSATVPSTASRELARVPGVILAEGQRVVPVRLRAGHRHYRTALTGLSEASELKVLRDRDLNPVPVPPGGLMLSRALADTLAVSIGTSVTVEVLDGKRPIRDLPVVALSDDILGFSATMDLAALNRALEEGDVINAAVLKFDPASSGMLWNRIRDMPEVEASSMKALWLSLFNDTIAGLIVVAAAILAGFGLLIAVGVVYNSARVAFHERAWELASLRILGFSRGEVSAILISELAIAAVIAIPLGLVAGRMLSEFIVTLRVRESFQIPVVIEPMTYAAAALVVGAATVASAFVIRRRIDSLDLVTVLKTRD